VKRLRAEILNVRRAGVYHSLTLVAPEIAERARPGQFVSVAMPEDRRLVLRRHFSVHQASRRGGWAGTLEFVVDPRGAGSSWLGEARAHQFLDVIGPMGKAFAYPQKLDTCLLVGDGHGAAPILFLAQELRARGKRVDMIVSASSEGEQGRVADVLPRVVEETRAQVVYAAGPRQTLRSVADLCLERRIPSQVAVEESMACGLGMCFTCVVPVIRKDGSGYDNVRSCVDGPVFNTARVFWDRWMGDVPSVLATPPDGFPAVRSWPG